MYKNYFFLNRFVIEINKLFEGFSLCEAYSQEKDRLVLDFHKGEKHYFLFISTNQNLPFIQVKEDFHRAKKNSVNFFQEYLPAVLKDISIAADDRIIRFNFDLFCIYFFIRGKNTNVTLIDSVNSFLSFKKITDNEKSIKEELIQNKYFTSFNFPGFVTSNTNVTINDIETKYPHLGKEIKKEAITRLNMGNTDDNLVYYIKNILEEIRDNNFIVFYDEFLSKFVMTVITFKSFSYDSKEIFDNYNDAFGYYLVQRYKYDRILNLKKIISRNLDQQLTKLSTKLNEINGKLNEPSKQELYKQYGDLLLVNKDSIRKGMKEIEVLDFYGSGEKIKIKLDETLDTKKNIDRYFEKARNEKQSKIYLSGLYETLSNKYNKFLILKNQYGTAQNLEEYLNIMDKMNIKSEQSSQSKKDEQPNYKHYIIENKYHVFVGKDSHNNDELTTKFAKQNDYWFHARGVPGSHTVLRVDNSKEVIPKPVIKKAASIAAYHSKAKTSKLAPVAYALKKFVTKRKGMEPGKVSMLKEDVLMVKPEIPENCEYISAE